MIDSTQNPPTGDTLSGEEEYSGLQVEEAARLGWRGRMRLVLIALNSLTLLPVQALLVRLPAGRSGLRGLWSGLWWPLAGLWHRITLAILAVRVQRIGRPAKPGPVLYVVNHISWLDILVLGAFLPRAAFVAKSEIAGWGAVAIACSLQRTLFINRRRTSDSARQRDALAERAEAGDSLILFPEGTSTDGRHVMAFKSALFSVAERAGASDQTLYIQPVTLAYTGLDGMPLTRHQRRHIAWIGDMELVGHVFDLLGRFCLRAEIRFHPAFTMAEAGSRKAAARRAEAAVRSGLADSHRQVARHGLPAGLARAGAAT